ncbi:MAG: FliG C-terminal domain-containing protein [Pseudomonadota bacterium]
MKKYTLSKSQRAAAVLVAMGKPRASAILKFFKSDELRAMIDAAHTLQTIPQPDLEELVQEFETEFAEGVGLIDSADTMQTILSEFMSEEELTEFIKKKTEVTERNEVEEVNVWTLIEESETDKTIDFLNDQPDQVAAILLTNLPAKLTATLIEQIDGEKRSKILARILSSRPVPKSVLKAVEDQLKEAFKAETGGGAKEVASKMAEILNEMSQEASEQVVNDFSGKVDDHKLGLIKAMMFRFEDLTSLAPAEIVALCDGLPTDLLTNALNGADPELTEALLSSIGARTRRMVESELKSDTGVTQETIEQSRKSIASLALKMASEGKIQLPNAA